MYKCSIIIILKKGNIDHVHVNCKKRITDFGIFHCMYRPCYKVVCTFFIFTLLCYVASLLDSLWNINNCEMSPAQNPQYTHIKENNNGFICSKISGHSYANVPVKCMGLHSHFI